MAWLKTIGNTTYRMVAGRYEHRLVAEAILGRPLRRDELVHHIDGNGLNNTPANLKVVSHAEHMAEHWAGIEPTAATDAHRVPPGAWSRHHLACVHCGTTERRHIARGLCSTCYRGLYGRTPH